MNAKKRTKLLRDRVLGRSVWNAGHPYSPRRNSKGISCICGALRQHPLHHGYSEMPLTESYVLHVRGFEGKTAICTLTDANGYSQEYTNDSGEILGVPLQQGRIYSLTMVNDKLQYFRMNTVQN